MKHNVYSLSSPFSSPPFPLSSLLFSFPFLFSFSSPFPFPFLSLLPSLFSFSSFPSFFFPFPLFLLPDFCSPSRFFCVGGSLPPLPPPPIGYTPGHVRNTLFHFCQLWAVNFRLLYLSYRPPALNIYRQYFQTQKVHYHKNILEVWKSTMKNR